MKNILGRSLLRLIRSCTGCFKEGLLKQDFISRRDRSGAEVHAKHAKEQRLATLDKNKGSIISWGGKAAYARCNVHKGYSILSSIIIYVGVKNIF